MSAKEKNDMPEPWLTVKEIAEHLKVSKESIYNWVNEGSIPAHKIGRFWRFRVSEVDGRITQQTKKGKV